MSAREQRRLLIRAHDGGWRVARRPKDSLPRWGARYARRAEELLGEPIRAGAVRGPKPGFLSLIELGLRALGRSR